MRVLVVTGAWIVAGLLLLVQVLFPWVDEGLLAATSPVEVASLVREGTLSSVPASAAYAVLVMPLLGAVLLVTAPARPRPFRILRVCVGVIGGSLTALVLVRLTDLHIDRLGPGAWIGTIGLVAVIVAIVGDLWPARREETA